MEKRDYLERDLSGKRLYSYQSEQLRELAVFSNHSALLLGVFLLTGKKGKDFDGVCEQLENIFRYYDFDGNLGKWKTNWYHEFLPRACILDRFTGRATDIPEESSRLVSIVEKIRTAASNDEVKEEIEYLRKNLHEISKSCRREIGRYEEETGQTGRVLRFAPA